MLPVDANNNLLRMRDCGCSTVNCWMTCRNDVSVVPLAVDRLLVSGWPTIPQLFVNGEFVGGCDIVTQMHQNGELEQLFNKKQCRVLQ